MAKRKKTLKKKKQEILLNKKALAAGVVICIGTASLYAKPEYLLGLYPKFSIPLSLVGNPLGDYADKQRMAYGIGGTGRFTVRIVPEIDVFAEGGFSNFSYPYKKDGTEETHQNIQAIDVAVGAGYNLHLNNRFSLNASLKAGAAIINNKFCPSAGLSVGLAYRLHPSVAVSAKTGVEFYNAQVIPVSLSAPGLEINMSQLFSDNPSKIGVEVVDQQPVFPVLYSWYEYNSFGTVAVSNLEDGPIQNVKVSFYQPQYMNQPNLCAEIDELGKEEFFEADLTAFFNERMMDLTELSDTQAEIVVEYKYLGQKRSKTVPVVISVYDRNSMNWEDDRRAASFVSSKDPAAMWFSKYITSIIRDNVRSGIPLNVQYAMGIFETLDQFGINYVIDPSSSYAEKIGGDSVDFLQFPYQTLMYRGGDCDDLSILTCSLFEAVGIKTAFITVPGHIYMAFDTGISEADAPSHFADMTQVILRDGKVWMPLEVTISDEGFSKAWRVGAREWNQAEAQDAAALYPMEDAWAVYRPVSVPGAQANFDMPDKKVVTKLFEHRIDEWVMRELEPSVQTYKTMLAKKYDKAVQNNLGVLYGRYGLFSEAENEFKSLRKEGYMPAVINTANVYFAKQSYNKALVSYQAVLREEPLNKLAVLGVSRCQWELGNYKESDKYYSILTGLDPALAKEYLYLSSFSESKGRSYALSERLENMTWDIALTEEELEAQKAAQELEARKLLEAQSLKDQSLIDQKLKEQNLGLQGSKSEAEDNIYTPVPVVLEMKSRDLEENNDTQNQNNQQQDNQKNNEAIIIPEMLENNVSKTESDEDPVEPENDLPDFLFASLQSLTPDNIVELEEKDETDEKAKTEETQIISASLDNISSINNNEGELDNDSDSEPELDSELESENKNEMVALREVPRFNQSPSALWAPESAFSVETIPGMKSFEEEMGNTQNEKAFLYEDNEEDNDDIENFDVFGTNEKEETVLVSTEVTVTENPFGSFFDDPEEATELLESIKAVLEPESSESESDKTENGTQIKPQTETVKINSDSDKDTVESVIKNTTGNADKVSTGNKPETETKSETEIEIDNKKLQTVKPEEEKLKNENQAEKESEKVLPATGTEINSESEKELEIESVTETESESETEFKSELKPEKKSSPWGAVAGVVAVVLAGVAGAFVMLKTRNKKKNNKVIKLEK